MSNVLAVVFVLACLWDFDTIAMERSHMPDVNEALAGKFVRHSDAFYRWRIADRRAKRKARPSDPALLDDLAVALDKTGRTAEAIALMEESLAANPARYESLANLGTLCIHSGAYERGLRFIRQAIEVNPDAHFGREVVQALVVEYVLRRRKDGRVGLPLRMTTSELTAAAETPLSRSGGMHGDYGFAGYSHAVDEASEGIDASERVRGIIGMMFFGNHESPVLNECLGDLLQDNGDLRLAARAYLKASYHAGDPATASKYRDAAKSALQMQSAREFPTFSRTDVSLADVEDEFRAEIEEARLFVAEIAAQEQAWIDAGVDVDLRFSEKYHAVGRTGELTLPIEWGKYQLGAVLLALVAGRIWVRRRRSRRARRAV